MIRGPGIKAKSVNHDPVVTIDIMPTIVHLTGATPPSNVDGTSLLPLLVSTRYSSRRHCETLQKTSPQHFDMVHLNATFSEIP